MAWQIFVNADKGNDLLIAAHGKINNECTIIKKIVCDKVRNTKIRLINPKNNSPGLILSKLCDVYLHRMNITASQITGNSIGFQQLVQANIKEKSTLRLWSVNSQPHPTPTPTSTRASDTENVSMSWYVYSASWYSAELNTFWLVGFLNLSQKWFQSRPAYNASKPNMDVGCNLILQALISAAVV